MRFWTQEPGAQQWNLSIFTPRDPGAWDAATEPQHLHREGPGACGAAAEPQPLQCRGAQR